MGIMDLAAWSVIVGLSCIAVGGLLLWTYGEALRLKPYAEMADSVHVAARKRFLGNLAYSAILIVFGLCFLVQGTFFVLH